MKEDNTCRTGIKTIINARKEGLIVQTERELREERYRIVSNQIKQRRKLFDHFYGEFSTPEERNSYYTLIDQKYRGLLPADSIYPDQVRDKMSHIRQEIAELRALGVNDSSIAELLKPQRPLSRVCITADYRIFLPEYKNIEIQLHPLPRAVFILFLRHPEGIVLKEIGDYFAELMSIYEGMIGDNINMEKARESIRRICNPLNNSLNEKISRIHETLRQILDETLAAKYSISGKRSGAFQIMIPEPLICWNTVLPQSM